ncbi:hypothetical protein [Proteus mirabilis]
MMKQLVKPNDRYCTSAVLFNALKRKIQIFATSAAVIGGFA